MYPGIGPCITGAIVANNVTLPRNNGLTVCEVMYLTGGWKLQ